MHIASPFSYKAAGSAADFLDTAIKGTTEILAGIQRVAASSVTRIILTSSFAAVGAWGMRDERNKFYTEADWFPVTKADVDKDLNNKTFVYLASEAFAEQAAWEAQKSSGLNESTAIIWNEFLKKRNPGGEVLAAGVPIYVDVRDIAKAHVLALDAPEAANKQFIVTVGLADSQTIAGVLMAEVPGAEERVPKGSPGRKSFPEDQWSASNRKAKELLGLEFHIAEETFRDTGRQLLELEKIL
ncbi:hypothetical protein N0V90_000198 [Kalmusia sp. IMI 367209]|nr:hypothetical protein N0V90_000198 [Kalmusia sp. IMI 367209]